MFCSGKLRLITGLDLIQGIPLQGNHYRELLQGMIDGAEIMLDGRYKQKDKKRNKFTESPVLFSMGELTNTSFVLLQIKVNFSMIRN